MDYVYPIPERGREALAKLLNATPEFLSALHDSLAKSNATLWRHELANKLSAELSAYPEADPESIGQMLSMLSGVLGWREEDESPSDLVAHLFRSAQQSGDERFNEHLPGWAVLRPALEKLLSIAKLEIGSKAALLFSQTQRHMHAARVITDARPIFTKRASEGPTGFVIIHTLQIEHFEDDEEHQWYLALDSDDLEALKRAVERAIEKERTLKRTLEATGVAVLTYREANDAST